MVGGPQRRSFLQLIGGGSVSQIAPTTERKRTSGRPAKGRDRSNTQVARPYTASLKPIAENSDGESFHVLAVAATEEYHDLHDVSLVTFKCGSRIKEVCSLVERNVLESAVQEMLFGVAGNMVPVPVGEAMNLVEVIAEYKRQQRDDGNTLKVGAVPGYDPVQLLIWSVGDVEAYYTYKKTPGASPIRVPLIGPQVQNFEITVTGTIHTPDGSPAANDTIVIYEEPFLDDSDSEYKLETRVHTDAQGHFQYTMQNRPHEIQYYQVYDTTDEKQFDPRGTMMPKDGSPDVFALEKLSGAESTDLGTMTLPEAYKVDISVVDNTGTPIPEAKVHVSHANGQQLDAGFYTHTNSEGEVDLEQSDDTGIELVGDVEIWAQPPSSRPDLVESLKRTLSVDSPTSITVTLPE